MDCRVQSKGMKSSKQTFKELSKRCRPPSTSRTFTLRRNWTLHKSIMNPKSARLKRSKPFKYKNIKDYRWRGNKRGIKRSLSLQQTFNSLSYRHNLKLNEHTLQDQIIAEPGTRLKSTFPAVHQPPPGPPPDLFASIRDSAGGDPTQAGGDSTQAQSKARPGKEPSGAAGGDPSVHTAWSDPSVR